MLPFQVKSQINKQADEQAWQEYRTNQAGHCIFGSAWPVYFGHLYGQSLRKHIQERLDSKLKKEPNDFAKRAMKHGTDNESHALELFKQCIDSRRISLGMDSFLHQDTEPGTFMTQFLSSVLENKLGVQCMLTPDACVIHNLHTTEWDSDAETVIWKNFQAVSVVEIKCPFTQQFKFDSLEEWVDDFNTRHKFGYASAFLQALLYGSVDTNCEQLYVVYYFVHQQTNHRCAVIHRFCLMAELRTWCLNHLKDFSDLLKQALVATEPLKKIRVPSARKDQVNDWMFLAHRESVTTNSEFITFDLEGPRPDLDGSKLQEESRADTGQDA